MLLNQRNYFYQYSSKCSIQNRFRSLLKKYQFFFFLSFEVIFNSETKPGFASENQSINTDSDFGLQLEFMVQKSGFQPPVSPIQTAQRIGTSHQS